VIPEHELVIAVTAQGESQYVFDAIWECLLPGLDHADGTEDDEVLAERLRRLSLPPTPGSAGPGHSVEAKVDSCADDSALPEGTTVIVDPVHGGWRLRLGSAIDIDIEAGYGEWRESSPLGRPVVAAGAWHGNTYIADLCIITTPHRVRLVLDADAGTAVATWSTVPLTGPKLELHLRSPLMTRPDVA